MMATPCPRHGTRRHPMAGLRLSTPYRKWVRTETASSQGTVSPVRKFFDGPEFFNDYIFNNKKLFVVFLPPLH